MLTSPTQLSEPQMCKMIASMQPHKHSIPRRPFQPEEDAHLIQILTTTPFVNWDSISQQFPDRTARQCRERWLNYLCPEVRTGPWTEDEDRMLIAMLNDHGRSWRMIQRIFNGRSENDIKNRWYSHLRFETVQEEGRIAFASQRTARKKRHRPVYNPKLNALRLLETQTPLMSSGAIDVEADRSPVPSEAAGDWKEEWLFADSVDSFGVDW